MNSPVGIADMKCVNPVPVPTDFECSQRAKEAVRDWLDAFSAAVRSVDYESGKALFAPDVVGFGTVGVMLDGLTMLVGSQWQKVWGVTSGFHFDMSRLVCGGNDDVIWAAVPWSSQGRTRDGKPFDRMGRGTYILHRRDGLWLAVHTHHSLDPSGKPPGV
jgi:ketosteroid isomerase-like protein